MTYQMGHNGGQTGEMSFVPMKARHDLVDRVIGQQAFRQKPVKRARRGVEPVFLPVLSGKNIPNPLGEARKNKVQSPMMIRKIAQSDHDAQVRCPFCLNLKLLIQQRDAVFNDFVCDVISALLGLEVSDILSPNRGSAKITFARQLSMYLCHVIGTETLRDIGAYFSRDRTTVAYACRLIEDMRDDAALNNDIEQIEAMMSLIVKPLANFQWSNAKSH